MKTKSKVKVKSKRDETVIEGQWRATARYGGSGREARRRRERRAEVSAPTPSGLSVLPPDHLRVLPKGPQGVLPGDHLWVYRQHPWGYYH